MKQFEYKHVNFKVSFIDAHDEIIKTLNEFGEDGWELVYINKSFTQSLQTKDTSGTGTPVFSCIVYLKRTLEN